MNNDGISGPEVNHTVIIPPPSLTLTLGDRVDIDGMLGTVISHDPTVWHGWPITVKTDSGRDILLTEDGRMYPEQTRTTVKVIGKTPVKIKRWQWLQKSAMTGEFILTKGAYSDEEAKEFNTFIRKIEETGVDCDE